MAFPPLFQVMSKNTNIFCMDSTHKTAKDITPIKEGSKVHNSVYLFTLLVKDKDVHQGIPVAFMACESESRTRVAFIHTGGTEEADATPFERGSQSQITRVAADTLDQAQRALFGRIVSDQLYSEELVQLGWKAGEMGAFSQRGKDGQVVTTNNWIESWHARLKGDHLGRDRNLRVDRLVYLLQDRVDRGFRFAYLKTKRGFQPIPWRKGDVERKQKADKVSFDEAQRKIDYNRDQPCDDGRLRISIQSFDPDTPDTYYILVVIARSGQLLSCSRLDFIKREPLPCKHIFLAERVFHDLWLSRFLRPSVSADIIEDRTVDFNDGPNDNINNDNMRNNNDTGIFEQDPLRDQLAVLNPKVYTQLEYERARREEEERHRRKEQRKRDFENAEQELCNNGRMIVELMNKKSKTGSLEDLQAAVASSKVLVHQLRVLLNK
ncbi:hypothetical protein BC939DRAFT_473904 [Gamsiella multidivaricata]|uniref:uncharacterized protein n=1 Tax=Gamsiella multidivaricata TaxID=101098 RepID=UPI00221E3EDC|nr:uncharacterized protein BC939DRAFT_473904 [Gamsiella multidivaricata]KAI7830339.1 hypothetical protein BC939DRAFT_473904 [Gamsiella multidivaricata]